MSNVAVLTDSTAGLPEAFMNALNIQTVAYYIHRGGEVLRDLVTIQREEFLRWLVTARFAPTTASPGPGDYLEAYERIAGEGADAITLAPALRASASAGVSIHMSSKISGAYQAATIAQSALMERRPDLHLEVIDTRNAALCQGWMVIEAARAALAGFSLSEITAAVRKMIPISHMIQTADTLRYLYLGGRIGKAQNLLGSMLNIKPLIGLEDGEIVPLGKAHSRGQAYTMMVEMLSQAIGKGRARIGYVHVGALREAERLKELVEAKIEVVESFIGELSPALAVHSGPGTAGLCYYEVEE